MTFDGNLRSFEDYNMLQNANVLKEVLIKILMGNQITSIEDLNLFRDVLSGFIDLLDIEKLEQVQNAEHQLEILNKYFLKD